MQNEKQTKKKLIECAKKEFIEKGFMKASLRNICKNAGVTTGAMYFFFKDKEELFESVVGKQLMELEGTIKIHFNLEDRDIEGFINLTPEDLQDDFQAATDILSLLYKYKDEYLLLMEKSQGTKYENIIDNFVQYLYEHYLKLYFVMKGYDSEKQLTDEDRFIVHWMSHDQIDIFIHLLTHCDSEEEAKKQLKNMFNYMVGGWLAAIRKELIS